MHREFPFSQRTSFTLIEVLLALTLTTLVVGITGKVAVQTVEARRYVEREVNRIDRTEAVFELLQEDFDGILFGMPGEASPIAVTGAPNQVLQLSTLTAVPDFYAALHTPRKPCRVRYQGMKFDEGDALIREVVDRSVLGPIPRREAVAIGINLFDVEILWKGQWLRILEPNDPKASEVTAIRVQMGWTGQDKPEIRTFQVPHGK